VSLNLCQPHTAAGSPNATGTATGALPAGAGLSPATRDRLARALLGLSIQALSGPGGLAAALRARLGAPLAAVSLPLDVGSPTPVIPPHLRRAATARHPCCAFPGCDTPATVCDIHHLVPRSEGGLTALPNLVPLCRFHHLVAVHDRGWQLQLHPDGTTTATSPQGRTIHSHSPPTQAA
ncbi:MAG TPA: HNH endonuclease signature motif containing protein, partial [Streptosporangiaceae bacterium]|nr:HNH endonuclease signature motif containing protein [Streptosporangiaceae bacterium]